MTNEMGRVLPFARSAAQVRRLADRQQEQGNALVALELLLLSRQRDAQDRETALSLAEMYADMRCWIASCDAYFTLIDDDAYAPEAFFGLGRNYFDMRLYALSRDCFVMALQRRPDAMFAPDAVEMLDAMEAAERPPHPAGDRLQRRVGRVLDALADGRPRLAANLMRRVIALDGKSSGILSLHALTLLAAGEAADALAVARRAYRADRFDLRALCALASALHVCGSEEAARSFLLRAAQGAAGDDDAHIVYDTACELEAHDVLVSLLAQAETEAPYAEDMLYLLAQAYYNTGRHEEAYRRWRLIRRIRPMETLASYYLDQAEKDLLPAVLPYTRSVPPQETVRRLRTLYEWTSEGQESLLARWREDERMEALARWGLSTYEPAIVQVMGGLLLTVNDARARAVLQSFLYDLDAPDTLKHGVLAALHAMGVPSPLYAITAERLAVVDVTRMRPEAEARRARAVERAAVRLLMPQTDEETQYIQALCARAEGHIGQAGRRQAARAVMEAYCAAYRRPLPASSTYPGRRKACRLGRRIRKEVDDALHQF